jgi:DNA (cytosine-5)-methyltransferase 1
MSTLKKINYLPFLESCWQEHLKPKRKNAPTVISTFAGCGGSSLGYSMAGFRELLAVEWDNNAVETFNMNFPGVPVYHGDIAKLSVDECLKMTGLKPGELDIFDGSPPCQGFSTAGKRKMSDDRNQLFHEYVRLLRGLKPKVFVMENVSGMVKGKMKIIFAEILRELKASGYKVSARLLNAMYFNVPQSRQRMIFIGVREDLGIDPSHPVAESAPIGTPRERGASNKFLAHKEETQARAHKARHISRGNGFGFVVLSESRPCPTFPKTQILQTSPLWEDSGKLRAPSICEIRSIGSYPGGFQFTSYDDAWERVGNSVPPLFMRSIANHIKTKILGETP